MRLTVFILLISVSCCMGVRGKYGGRSNSRRNRIPPYPYPPTSTMRPRTTRAPPPSKPISPADDILAAEIGVRLPPKECVISYDEFVEHVANMDWITPYAIDNDFPINPEMTLKWQPHWSPINESHVQRTGSYWDNLKGECGYLDSTFRRVDRTKAIFGLASPVGGAFSTAARTDFILSFDPSKYAIQYICFSNRTEGRCRDSEILFLIKEQREGPANSDGIISGDICMDDIPWGLVETTFRNCLGQKFVDNTEPQLEWFWTDDPDCAKPDSDAFRSQIAKRK